MDDVKSLFHELFKFTEEKGNYSYYDFLTHILQTHNQLHHLLKNRNIRLAVSEYLRSKNKEKKHIYNEPAAIAIDRYYEVLKSYNKKKSGDDIVET